MISPNRFPNVDAGKEYDGILKAVSMAEKKLKDNPDILPGYSLNVKVVQEECKPDLVLRQFISYYSHRKHLVGVLGPCKYSVQSCA